MMDDLGSGFNDVLMCVSLFLWGRVVISLILLCCQLMQCGESMATLSYMCIESLVVLLYAILCW